MARFTTKKIKDFKTNGTDSYEHGFSYSTDSYKYILKPGLNEGVVKEISGIKNEPEWMLKIRLEAYKAFQAKQTPIWGADLSEIDYDKIHYYLRASDRQEKSWDDVPADVKETFEKLGIPKAERAVLAGVKAQYDCLTADAKIFTKDGIKEIIEVKKEDVVLSLNEKTGLLVEQKVLGFADKGRRQVYKVKTQGGREIKVTSNHPFYCLVYTKKIGKKRGSYKKEWRYLSQLNKGDLISLLVDYDFEGKPYSLPKITIPKMMVESRNQFSEYNLDISQRYKKISFPKKTNSDLLWLLGFYLGDGFMAGDTSKSTQKKYSRIEIAIPKSEEGLRSEARRIVSSLFSYEVLEKANDRVVLNSVLFVQFFIKLGLSGLANQKRIPKWVFSLPKKQKLSFIGGYFDADGGIRKAYPHALVFTSVSRELLDDLKMLAISCGLNTSHIWNFESKQKYKGKVLVRKGHRVQLSGDILSIDSRFQRKKSLFAKKKYIHRYKTAQGTDFRKHTTKHIGFSKIISIEKLSIERVYDIEVEGYHNFIANGLVVHNSEVVYGSLKDIWAKDGVVFLSMDDGLAQYPDLVKEYFNKIIPFGDNKFSALNTATWSGGSFVYIPKGVHVSMPLQTYFRINSANAGQFERTLIIVDEGASVHYIEGCFTAGTKIITDKGPTVIEDITKGVQVLTHKGQYKLVYHTQVRPYSGKLFTLIVTGQPSEKIEATEEHPFLVVKRKYKNERNKEWKPEWLPIKDIKKGDYVCTPIDKTINSRDVLTYEVPVGNGASGWQLEKLQIPCTQELFKLIGYYLAEGSISGGSYLNFSFSKLERKYIEEVKRLIKSVFSENRVREFHHEKNNGTNVVISSVRLCRFFEQFGTHSNDKQMPDWVLQESLEKQAVLIDAWYKGDGNYYRKQNIHGFKEVFRISTVSKNLSLQGRMLLLRLGIASSLNQQDKSSTGRQTMHNLVIGGEYMILFGKIVGQPIQPKMWNKKRATYYFVDDKYLYSPVRKIDSKEVDNISVYNFSVKDDESYVAGGVAVHNCTAPNFSSGSLHAAVVEIYVKKGARCQYTTVQNWYKNIYNLVTKRAYVEEEAEMIWTDFNMGSKVTMKYPGFVLAGKGARGEVLSMALAGSGQHQDTGTKSIHLAPHTSSSVVAKSISKGGGRTSYRGLVNVGPHAHTSKNTVICDALLLDGDSRSDTYPIDKIFNSNVEIQHEATVSKIGDDQLFYLMSRGVTEEQARKMIVNGFIDDLVRKLPMEYAVEMNRLIDHEMEGSIG